MTAPRATVELFTRAPIALAWETATQRSPVDFYAQYGPLPAVIGVRGQTGDWNHESQTRTLELSGGDSVIETITDVAPLEFFAYNLSDFSGLFGNLVEGARAEWDFWRESDGSCIRWSYSFEPKPGRGLAVALIVKLLWSRYMRATLPKIVRAAEQTAVAN